MERKYIYTKSFIAKSIYFGDYRYDVNCKCGNVAEFEYQNGSYKKAICVACIEAAA